MGNDLGSRLNGTPSCPSSLSCGPPRTPHVTRSRTSASVEERSCKQVFVIAITSQTQRRRYSLLECSGGVSSEHFWIEGKRLRATTKAPQRGKGYAFSARRSSILVPSRRSELNLLLPMVGGRWGR